MNVNEERLGLSKNDKGKVDQIVVVQVTKAVATCCEFDWVCLCSRDQARPTRLLLLRCTCTTKLCLIGTTRQARRRHKEKGHTQEESAKIIRQ